MYLDPVYNIKEVHGWISLTCISHSESQGPSPTVTCCATKHRAPDRAAQSGRPNSCTYYWRWWLMPNAVVCGDSYVKCRPCALLYREVATRSLTAGQARHTLICRSSRKVSVSRLRKSTTVAGEREMLLDRVLFYGFSVVTHLGVTCRTERHQPTQLGSSCAFWHPQNIRCAL